MQDSRSLRPQRLRRRAEFQAAAKGVRWTMPGFSLQMQWRPDSPQGPEPRFGITVTKKTAPRAVDRNRIRRRLREALRLGAALPAAPGRDYVIVARQDVLSLPFDQLREQLSAALSRISQRERRVPKTSRAS